MHVEFPSAVICYPMLHLRQPSDAGTLPWLYNTHQTKAEIDCKMTTKHVGRVELAHGSRWNSEWYVPFEDGHAIIYHGHDNPNDHSDCGPKVFCCPKAAQLLRQYYPNAIPVDAEWQFILGDDLAVWIGPDGPQIYYFFFCDPEDSQLLRFVGVAVPEVRDILLKRLSLDPYLEDADRIRGPVDTK